MLLFVIFILEQPQTGALATNSDPAEHCWVTGSPLSTSDDLLGDLLSSVIVLYKLGLVKSWPHRETLERWLLGFVSSGQGDVG